MIPGNSPSYLIKNPYSFCFRMIVPKDLQPTIARKELRYSLGTGNLSDAKAKARYLAAKVQMLFRDIQSDYLENMDLSKKQIQSMLKKFMHGLIEEYNKPVVSKDYADEWDSAAFSSQDGLEETVEFIDEIKADLNLRIQTGNYSMAGRKADRLLAEEGISESQIDKSSHAYAELCSGIYRAMIKGQEYKQTKFSGSFSDDLEDVLNGCLPGSAAPLPLQPEVQELPSQKSKTIGQVLSDYLDEGGREGKWTEKPKVKLKPVWDF